MTTKTKQLEDKKVPKLRFPGFFGGWEEKKLGEVCDIFDSKRIPLESTERQKRKGVYPYYGASGIIDYIDGYLFDGEYILLGEDGANIIDRSSRLAFLVRGKFWVNNHAHVLQARGSNYFLSEYLESLKYDKYNTGTAQPKLNSDVVKKIKIIIPSLLEQQKIADFLSAVDNWIENLRKQKENLENYKKGMMQKIFSQEIRFKDENGDGFPDWEKKTLKEYLSLNSKRNIDNEVNLVLSVNNKKGFITQEEQFEDHRVASDNVINYKIVEKNNFAYNPSRINVGSIARLKIFEKGIVSPMYVVFKLLDAVDPEFFENFIQTHYFKYLVKAGCSGSVRDSLNFEDLQKFKVIFPNLTEQQKIAKLFTVVDDLIGLKEQQITQAEQWKNGLMQRLFA